MRPVTVWVAVLASPAGMAVQSPQALSPSFCRYSQPVTVVSVVLVQVRITLWCRGAAWKPAGLAGAGRGVADASSEITPAAVALTARILNL